MPWQTLIDSGWLIVGMNHYMIDGTRHLYCSMTRHGRCITAEGEDEKLVFENLVEQANMYIGKI